MIRKGKRYKPVLLGATAPKAPMAPGISQPSTQYLYNVQVDYIDRDGADALWSGSFYAANMQTAENMGRDFVVKYLQPQSIIDAATVPDGFTTTEPTPILMGTLAANENRDSMLATGTLGPLPIYGTLAAVEGPAIDLAAITGSLGPLPIIGSLDTVEPGPDSAAITGTLT
jgi:hypothetical protein